MSALMIRFDFRDKQGRCIDIRLDEDASHAEAWHNGKLIGHMDWNEYPTILGHGGEDEYGALLTNIYLDKVPGYTRCGIGKRIVEAIRECTGMEVLMRRDNGTTREDGSHPTQDAGRFFAHLARQNLASWID
ncbi:MAG: hypothetical protein IPM27_06245 [Nitrosomonadales bacterium]|nr:hypothetical protein [Nitrosomonadales bacterium]